VNSLVVEEFFDVLRHLRRWQLNKTRLKRPFMRKFDAFFYLHVFVQIETSDVSGCNDSIAGELPYVELVHGQNTVDGFQKLAF